MRNAPKTVRVGIAGLGYLARQVHIPLLRTLPHVHIAAIADPDQDAVTRCLPLLPGSKPYASLADMLQDAALDAVILASPTGEHARQACEVLRANRALYLEKPLAADAEEGLRVLQAAAASAVPAMMGFNYRFHPLAVQMRRKVQSCGNSMDRGRSIFTIAPRPLPQWKQKRSSGGGALLDLATHHFDLLRYLLAAEIVAVSARIWSERSEADCCEVELEFSSGARVRGIYSFCRAEQDLIELSGAGGRFVLNRYAPLSYPLWPPMQFVSYQRERWRSPWKEVSYRRSLYAWIESIRSHSEPPVTLRDGMEAMRAVAAAEASARTGERISLEKDLGAGGLS